MIADGAKLLTSAAEHPQTQTDQARCPIRPWQRTIKYTLDVFGSFLLLVLLSPLIVLAALSIKIHDGGPVIYRRRVVGLKGEFDAFKLRTMCVNADDVLQQTPHLRTEFEQNFKLKSDPRITLVGRILRKFSIDELPQLFNVLKGQMSLVGPRMVNPAELEKFEASRWIFAQMKPGMTGYWQVYGRQEVSYSKRVNMETFYVENWSLLLDLKILLRTPFTVLRGTGAY